MGRKKIPADYHAIAEKYGFRWLGPEVPNTRIKSKWKCKQDHQWEVSYSSIQQGSGCPFCTGKARKTPADYYALAEKRGFRWLGPQVRNVMTKTKWECKQGHQWETRYCDIQQGSGCVFCAKGGRKLPSDYYALAEKRGFRWLGPEVPNIATRTRWECKQGHQWEARYHSIEQGTSCPFCGKRRRKLPSDYHALAEKCGLCWLGPQVPNVMTRTRWECKQGHQWEIHYNSIHQGNGCPFCAKGGYNLPSDYHALAKERGLCWSGPQVSNINTRTKWECKQGHQWEASYRNIRRDSDCPLCADEI